MDGSIGRWIDKSLDLLIAGSVVRKVGRFLDR